MRPGSSPCANQSATMRVGATGERVAQHLVGGLDLRLPVTDPDVDPHHRCTVRDRGKQRLDVGGVLIGRHLGADVVGAERDHPHVGLGDLGWIRSTMSIPGSGSVAVRHAPVLGAVDRHDVDAERRSDRRRSPACADSRQRVADDRDACRAGRRQRRSTRRQRRLGQVGRVTPRAARRHAPSAGDRVDDCSGAISASAPPGRSRRRRGRGHERLHAGVRSVEPASR